MASRIHPSGFAAHASPELTCADCAWFLVGPEGVACRQAPGASLEPGGSACERWEGQLDCQDCAACCRQAFQVVTISLQEPFIARHPRLVRHRSGSFELARRGDRCAALTVLGAGPGGRERYACAVHDDRPRSCRDFERGGERCLAARRRVGWSP